MSALPSPVRTWLVEFIARERSAAALLIDADGALLEWYGAVERYGLVDLEPGLLVSHRHEWLAGLLPADDAPLVMPDLAVDASRHFDAHVLPDGPRAWVVLLDASQKARHQLAAQQSAHELALLRRAVGVRGPDEPFFADLVQGLGVAVLSREADGGYRARGATPEWFTALYPEVLRGAPLDPLSFLGNFIAEAEAHRATDDAGPLRSGEWVEAGPDGRDRHCEATAVRLGPGGSAILVELLRETHERRRILQTARENSLELRRLMKEIEHRDVLLHCIVHDLGGPLTAIQGALEMLGQDDVPPTTSKRLVNIGLGQSRALEARIREILGVFRAEVEALEAFTVDPLRAPDALDCLRGLTEAMGAAFSARRVGLTLLQPDDTTGSWRVVGQTERLERVLSNLLENALRHAPAGSTVELSVARTAADVLVHIADRGPGVPPAMQARLFDKFTHGPNSGKGGLGLYFCRMTLERWGGDIRHEPREGGGAVFVVRLRRAL